MLNRPRSEFWLAAGSEVRSWLKYCWEMFTVVIADIPSPHVEESVHRLCLGNHQSADPITCNTHFSLSHSQSLSKLGTHY